MKHRLVSVFTCALTVACAVVANVGLAATVALKNGSFLDADRDTGLPRQSVVMVFPGGPSLVAKEQQGLVEVVTDILDEGPASMTPDEYRRALFLTNAEIKVSATIGAMLVTVRAPAETLKQAIELADKLLREPRMDEATFKDAHAKVATKTNVAFDEMQAVVFFYGIRTATQHNPVLFDGSGSPASVKNITFASVKDAYGKLIDRSHLYFVSAGPTEPAAVGKVIDDALLARKDTPKFVRAPGRDLDVANMMKKSAPGMRVAVIHKPKAVDNQVLFIFPEPIRRATKEDVIGVVSHNLLGGGLVGRLGRTLRKERGLTYHASSMIGQPGWMVYTFGGDQQVEPLLKGVKEVVQKFKAEAIPPKDIDEAKEALANTHRQRYELPSDVLMEKVRLRLLARDEDYVSKYPGYLQSVSASEVQAFVRNKLNMNHGFLVVMGDREKLLPVLQKAGYAKDAIDVVEVGDVM